MPKLWGYKTLNQRSRIDRIPLPTDNGKFGNSTDSFTYASCYVSY